MSLVDNSRELCGRGSSLRAKDRRSLKGMKLPQIAKSIPPLYGTQHVPLAEKIIHAKWFTPFACWSWLVAEYDPNERLAFGLVVGMETEWGYFSLDELEAIR